MMYNNKSYGFNSIMVQLELIDTEEKTAKNFVSIP